MSNGRVGDRGLTAEGPSGRAAGWLPGCIITGELILGTRLFSGDSQSLELGRKELIPGQELDSGRSYRGWAGCPKAGHLERVLLAESLGPEAEVGLGAT